MNRIPAVRKGEDVSALREEIDREFADKGYFLGHDEVSRILHDFASEDLPDKYRQGYRDELAHFAERDPAEIGRRLGGARSRGI